MTRCLKRCQIAIAGGGIAGLTLGLIFEKLNISYVLFEARNSLEPETGAGVGLQPNGLRILDQLGLLEEIEANTLPLSTWIGYGVCFIERRKLISIMASRLQRKDCIHTSARVTSIREFDEHVEVETADGLSVTADVLLGADGVRSCVRKFIDSSVPGNEISATNADEYMSCGFNTVYGMSSPTKGIEPGERFAVYREKENIIGFTGKDVVFWFVFGHLDQRYQLTNIPRFTEDDAVALCKSLADIKVTPSLRFGDLYANKTASLMVGVEEGMATKWHTTRTAILGDAACKMTPAGGQGANQAIESCAVLVNELMRASKGSREKTLSRDVVERALERYFEQRQEAAKIQLQRSQMVLEALFCYPGPPSNFLKQLANISDEDWLLRAFTALSKAPILDDFELTERGHMYNKTCQALHAKVEARPKEPEESTNAALATDRESDRHVMMRHLTSSNAMHRIHQRLNRIIQACATLFRRFD